MKPIRFEDLILYEDEAIIVVNKPWSVSSLDDKNAINLQQMARRYTTEAHLCHRLDKMTSGALVIAKDLEVYRHISLQFQNREVQKQYQTLVHGIHSYDGLKIDLALHVSTNKKVVIDLREGKEAITYVYTESHFATYTRLRCEPLTGRMHQIRVHLSAIKCPIVGDALYGGKDIFLSDIKRRYKESMYEEEKPINNGFLLHAESLRLKHPMTEEPMVFKAPLGKNFEVVLKVLTKYNR